jgi:hypothetical protein
MAADLADVSGVFSPTVQGYATLGASLVLGLITIYGYFRKLKADDAQPAADPTLKEIAANTKLIAELMGEQKRQADIDRAYNKGRDDALDKAAALVAQRLHDKP